MENWHTYVNTEILPLVAENKYWKELLQDIVEHRNPSTSVHLAIFIEPYLSFILEGKKTVESRFGKTKHSPYGNVKSGDILLLKKSGGPVVGLCEVSSVWFYTLNHSSWKLLRKEFTVALCAQDPEFWKQRKEALFATLMQVKSVIRISPVAFAKADRRGWVVLHSPNK